MRVWLYIEVGFAFTPLVLLLLLGVFVWPFALSDLMDDGSIDKVGYLVIFGVPSGVLGLYALSFLFLNFASGKAPNKNIIVLKIFLSCGFVALFSLSCFVIETPVLLPIVVFPFFVSLHIVYLQRRFLFRL